jgi:hypothetical protein
MILKKCCGVHALRIAVGITMLGLLFAGSANAANLSVCPSGCAYSNILKAIYASGAEDRKFDGIGVYNREVVSEVDNPLIKYQVIQSTPRLIDYQESSNVIFNKNEAVWSKTKSRWTDIEENGFIQESFNVAKKYKDEYEYGVFLLQEEMTSPVALTVWAEPFNTWKLNGTLKLNCGSDSLVSWDNKTCYEAKLLRTWTIEDKKQVWNQSWFDNLDAGTEDISVREWEKYYTLNLYEAWNDYMHYLNKKSIIVGMMSTECGNDSLCPDYGYRELEYSLPAYDYVFQNYDGIIDYAYPRNFEEVDKWSVRKVKFLNWVYTNPNGKLFWVLTTSFTNRKWIWSESVAEKEYKSVKPYVNVIMSYPYANMDTRTDTYPKYLLKFYNNN